MRTHLVIPDTQTRPETPKDHLSWIGRYALEKMPDVIVHLGDHADMASLSFYDQGKKKAEGRRLTDDIEAAKEGLRALLRPIDEYNEKQRRTKHSQYRPRKIITLGNHEFRLVRCAEDNPKFDGHIGTHNLEYESFGFEVYPFKEIATVDGVSYSHYFYYPMTGRPISGTIDNRLKNIGFSFIQGHQQVYMVGVKQLNNGKRIRGLICGACYLHDEEYRGPQANGEWRGVFLLHEVRDGDYVLCEVSLDFLCRRYEGVGVAEFMRDVYPDIYEQSTWMQRAA